jgi:hypothetical protein
MESMVEITTRRAVTMQLTLPAEEAPLTIEAASVRRCNEHLFSVAFLSSWTQTSRNA